MFSLLRDFSAIHIRVTNTNCADIILSYIGKQTGNYALANKGQKNLFDTANNMVKVGNNGLVKHRIDNSGNLTSNGPTTE